jgi:hypothetical protein
MCIPEWRRVRDAPPGNVVLAQNLEERVVCFIPIRALQDRVDHLQFIRCQWTIGHIQHLHNLFFSFISFRSCKHGHDFTADNPAAQPNRWPEMQHSNCCVRLAQRCTPRAQHFVNL